MNEQEIRDALAAGLRGRFADLEDEFPGLDTDIANALTPVVRHVVAAELRAAADELGGG